MPRGEGSDESEGPTSRKDVDGVPLPPADDAQAVGRERGGVLPRIIAAHLTAWSAYRGKSKPRSTG